MAELFYKKTGTDPFGNEPAQIDDIWGGPAASIGETLAASFTGAGQERGMKRAQSTYTDLAVAENEKEIVKRTGKKTIDEALDPYVKEAFNAALGQGQVPQGVRLQPGLTPNSRARGTGQMGGIPPEVRDAATQALIFDLQGKGQGQGLLSGRGIHYRALELQAEAEAHEADLATRDQSMRGTVLRFLGHAGYSMSDPLAMATMPVGGGGGLLAFTAKQTGLGAGVSLVNRLDADADWMQGSGTDTGALAAGEEAAIVGVEQGAFTAAGVLAGKAIGAGARKLFGVPQTVKDAQAAARVKADILQTNPGPQTPKGEAAHIARVLETQKKIDADEPFDPFGDALREMPKKPVKPVALQSAVRLGDKIYSSDGIHNSIVASIRRDALNISDAELARVDKQLDALSADDFGWLVKGKFVSEKPGTATKPRANFTRSEIEAIRKDIVGTAPKGRRPLSAAEFIAYNGGIDRGQFEGEFRQMGADKFRWNGKQLVRRGGMSVNDALDLLVKEGYLHDAGYDSPTIQRELADTDVLTLLSEDINGERQLSAHDATDTIVADREAFKANKAAFHSAVDRISEAMTDPLDRVLKTRAIEILIEHPELDGADALERALIEAGQHDELPGSQAEGDVLSGEGAKGGDAGTGGTPPGGGDGIRIPVRDAAGTRDPGPINPELAKAQSDAVPEPDDKASIDALSDHMAADLQGRLDEITPEMVVSTDPRFTSAQDLLDDLDADTKFVNDIRKCL